MDYEWLWRIIIAGDDLTLSTIDKKSLDLFLRGEPQIAWSQIVGLIADRGEWSADGRHCKLPNGECVEMGAAAYNWARHFYWKLGRRADITLTPPQAAIFTNPAAVASVVPISFCGYGDLAKKHQIDPDKLRRRLGPKWRHRHDGDYHPVENPGPREEQFLYKESAVMPIIDSLPKLPANGQPKKS